MTDSSALPLSTTMTVGGGDFAAQGSFDVYNPATGRVLAQAPSLSPDALTEVYGTAQTAFRAWRHDDGARRASLSAAADALEESAERVAALLTAEQGKPLAESRSEVSVSVTWLRYYADLEVPREVIRDDSRRYQEIFRRPLGVVAAIAPWNYPLTLAVWKIAPALRAGNTIVVKPSPYTPLTTLALGHVLRGAFPDGVLNVISGLEPLGSAMVAHPVPRKVSFTGSTPVGKHVAAAAAADLKRTTLELGGNDPAIVLADADVATMAHRLFWGAFRNNGQTCFAVKRVYAHRSVHSDLVEALADLARNAKVDDGTAPDVDLGPVNNEAQRQVVDDLVQDAVRGGARIVTGGSAIDRDGYFYEPTIVDGVDNEARLVSEEQFGPALPVLPFVDDQQAIDLANASPYGLTASVWSSDVERATSLATQIDSGQVSVNIHGGGVLPHLPFGGRKWSGIGVENGPWGLHEFTEPQTISAPGRRDADKGQA